MRVERKTEETTYYMYYYYFHNCSDRFLDETTKDDRPMYGGYDHFAFAADDPHLANSHIV